MKKILIIAGIILIILIIVLFIFSGRDADKLKDNDIGLIEGEGIVCSFVDPGTEERFNGYIKEERLRINKQNQYLLIADNNIYLWEEGVSMGSEISFDSESLDHALEFPLTRVDLSKRTFLEDVKNLADNCIKTAVDNDFFYLPMYVEFYNVDVVYP